MIERCTEKARRAISAARVEARQFNSPYLETEHLLLGVLREDKALYREVGPAAVESIRTQIKDRATIREEASISVDLPMSDECKRVLEYAAQEADLLSHKHVGTEHLLLGVLRAEGSFAAQRLMQGGIFLESVRVRLAKVPVWFPRA